ncbi:hypothetical protein BVRB_1g005990 [Beta vulgaris subsp. vulgaris]|nr:hypothetical protein BVRB_1g005990 [Beta vulgaris subsp. vulgaris]
MIAGCKPLAKRCVAGHEVGLSFVHAVDLRYNIN